MEQVAPRTTAAATAAVDEAMDNTVKPFFKSNQPRSNPAFVSVSHVTTSAEITNPSLNNKLKSVPIPQPLLLKKPPSRSSMSSIDDDNNIRNTTQLPPQVPSNETSSSSFTATRSGTATKQIPNKKKSFFVHGNNGDEYASSPGSEPDVHTTTSNTSPMFSLRYANSPPAGSGGKYMIKSKRSSWIVDAGVGGVQTPSSATASDTINSSTPSTPVSLPETVRFSRSRKSSTIDDNNTRSKLRENNFIYDEHQRTCSISSILTDNISILSDSEEYESCNDNGSILSPDINQNRRSSGCILGNMSSADLVDIINGNMPNPVYSHPPSLPEYQLSLQTFLKRQLSNSTTISPNSVTEADKDVVEIDLDDTLSCPFNNPLDTHSKYQSPVYPAIFLNNNNADNVEHEQDEAAITTIETKDNDMNHDNTSVPDINKDYFILTDQMCQESKSVPIRRRSLLKPTKSVNKGFYAQKLQSSRLAKIRKWSPYHQYTNPKWVNWMDCNDINTNDKVTSWWNSVIKQSDNNVESVNQQQNPKLPPALDKKHKHHMSLNLHELPYQFPTTESVVNASTTDSTPTRSSFSMNSGSVGYRFNNPNKNPFQHFGENYDSFTSPLKIPAKQPHNGCPRLTIKTRLYSAKDACNLELRRIIDGLNEYVEKGLLYQKEEQDLLEWDATIKQKNTINNDQDIVSMISEDSYLPTPFILTLQDVICLAQSVLDTDLEIFLENSGACADTVSSIQAVGMKWDYNREWPCRKWYVRLLLSVAALNRVVEWWQAERSFWSANTLSNTTVTPTPTTTSNGTTTTVTPLFKPTLPNEDNMVSRTRDNSVMSSSLNTNEDKTCQLQEEAEIGQSRTIVMELSLISSTIQYLSPVWHDVIGTRPQLMIGLNISQLLMHEDKDVFCTATSEMLADDSRTVEVIFHVINDQDPTKPFEMEGKGMLMYNHVTGEPSHTMWVMKSLEVSRRWSIIDNSTATTVSDLLPLEKPPFLSEKKVPSSSVIENIKSIAIRRAISQGGTPVFQSIDSTSHLLTLSPALCNICERLVVAAFFEQHSELCAEIHRAEMDVVTCNDSLTELRHYVQGLCDLTNSEVQELENNPELYLQHQVETIFEDDENVNDDASINSEKDSIFGESLPLEEDRISPIEKKRAELEKYVSLLDIMNAALSIATPGYNDNDEDDETESMHGHHSLRLRQSELSKSKIIQILYWRAPHADDADTESLILDIELITKSKVDAVNRTQDCLEYNERTRKNFQMNVMHDSEWSEFVVTEDDNVPDEPDKTTSTLPETEINQVEPKTEIPPKTDQNNQRITPAKKAPEDEERGSVNRKKNIFKKIKDWKSKGKRCSSKQSKRNSKRKQNNTISGHIPQPAPANTTSSSWHQPSSSINATKILEMEVIDTPMASPRFPALTNSIVPSPRRSSLTHHQQQRIQQQSSGTATPALVKSPLSPLPAAINSTRPVPPSIKDFDIIKPISKGAFGSVFLAKKRVTGDYYAIKFLKKSDMIAKNQVTNVKAERMILMTQTDSPFVTKLYYTFQSKDYLYLVMEYLNGGDCSSLIKVLGTLPCDWARNYLAEVTLGLSYLHDKHIIHRDLKPDNLLIDQNGHLKLTDFGLSRIGFLDRRVRDELSNGPLSLLPSSPAPSRSGTPPQSPSANAMMPLSGSNGKLYKHSYFSLLFDGKKNRRGSLASSASGSESANGGNQFSSATSMTSFVHGGETINAPLNLHDDLNPTTSSSSNSMATSNAPVSTSRPHRQRTSSGLLSSGLITPTAFVHTADINVENGVGGDARQQQDQAVGTPDYLAPESILGTGQDSMVDWWALGVICYEFLYGYPPFHAETPDKVFENILSRNIDWHKDEIHLPEEAYDFMERLLTLDPEQRLGRNGPEEVRQHPFFKDLDWEKLLSDSPSFVPQPMNEEDTDYFDARGATMMMEQQDNLQNLVLEEIKRAQAIINEQDPDKIALVDNNAANSNTATVNATAATNASNAEKDQISFDDVDFGTFVYKNLPVLEKANEDAIRKIRHERIVANTSSSSSGSSSISIDRMHFRSLPAISRRKRSSIAETVHSRNGSNSSTVSSLSPLTTTKTNTSASTSLPCTPPLALSPSSSAKVNNIPTNASATPPYRRSVDISHAPINHAEKLKLAEDVAPNRVRSVSSPGNRVAVLAAAAAATAAVSTPNSNHSFTSAPSMTNSVAGSLPTSSTSNYGSSANSSCTNSPILEKHHHHNMPLPLQISLTAHPLDTGSSSPLSATTLNTTTKTLNCLIADDNPISCKILETILQLLQCRCVIVRNGAQAIRCAMGDKVQFDFIFMDIRMPIIDGEAAARMIKSTNNINRNTPIIAVTAYERTLQLASVFDDTLCKPVTKEIVLRCIRHITDRNSTAIHWSSTTSINPQQQQQQQHYHHQTESVFPLSASSSPVNVKDALLSHQNHHQSSILTPYTHPSSGVIMKKLDTSSAPSDTA